MRAVLGGLLILLLAGGCASRASVRHVAGHVQALQDDLGALRRAQQDVQRESAETRAELDALQERLRELTSAVNAAGAELAQVRARLAAAEDDLKAVRSEMVARAVAVAPPPPAERPPAEPPANPAVRPSDPATMYQAALATFRAREHGQAVLEFLDFLARYPQHPLAANAQYWIGEAYYAQRDFRQALSEFQKVLEHPNVHGKWADALLKIGMCYEHLRERTRAREVWQRLIAEFPSSEAAARARGLLAARR
jgi:tol-pal system protein YbgF